MSDNNRILAGVATYAEGGENNAVTTLPEDFSEERTLKFVIQDFANLSDKCHDTPFILCHGYRWFLAIYPHGLHDGRDPDAAPADRPLSIFLHKLDAEKSKSLRVAAKFFMKIGSIKLALLSSLCDSATGYGYLNAGKRNKIMGLLDTNGSLTVWVHLRVARVKWTPPKTLKSAFLPLFESGKNADIIFCFEESRRLRAHTLVLATQGQVLPDMAASADDSEIPLDGIDCDLFQEMIRFHYTAELSDGFDYSGNSIELLKLADKFGVTNLKLLLEYSIVDKMVSKETMIELFQLAKAHNCALLLESCMELMLTDDDLVSSEDWHDISATPEFVKFLMLQNSQKTRGNQAEVRLDHLGVRSLRTRAAEKDLDVDGSRDTLIKRLKEAEN